MALTLRACFVVREQCQAVGTGTRERFQVREAHMRTSGVRARVLARRLTEWVNHFDIHRVAEVGDQHLRSLPRFLAEFVASVHSCERSENSLTSCCLFLRFSLIYYFVLKP